VSRRSTSGDGADSVKVVGYERFVGDEKKEREFFENGDLGDTSACNGLVIGLVLILQQNPWS